MSISISKALKPEITRQLYNIERIKSQIANITNSKNFSVGTISQRKLIIYTNQHNLLKLRRHEDQIIYLLGQNFNFNKIDWRIMQESQTKSKQKQTILRDLPKTNYFLTLSKKCKHQSLSNSLKKLSTTLSKRNNN